MKFIIFSSALASVVLIVISVYALLWQTEEYWSVVFLLSSEFTAWLSLRLLESLKSMNVRQQMLTGKD